MLAYTLQVNKPSAYIPYKIERHKDNTFGHSTLYGMKADLPSDILKGDYGRKVWDTRLRQ